MIPVSESVQTRRPAWITAGLIIVCTLAFIYELALPTRALDRLIQEWGADPGQIVRLLSGDPRVPRAELLTLFTSQFLHGGWLHLLGNMLFLWVFGRAVEDRFGHSVYLALYLVGGAGASIIQSLMSGPQTDLVLIGASGSIATVLGAYLASYPGAWVRVLVPIFFFFWFFDVPAVLMLALWFLGQFFTGIASITEAAAPGNVAVWAHVGGFVIGVLVGFLARRGSGLARAGGSVARRADGPGPAGLVASIANLVALALGLRVMLLFLGVRPGPGLVGQVAGLAYAVTSPVVRPLQEIVPWITVAGRPVDLAALVIMVLVLVAAGAVIQSLGDRRPRASRSRARN